MADGSRSVPVTDQSRELNQHQLPQGYLRLSDAMERLSVGVWGGLKRATILRGHTRGPPAYGRWREYSAERITNALLNGQLKVFVVAEPQLESEESSPPPPPTKDPVVVPTDVLERLISWRNAMPDHVLRPTLKTAGNNEQLLVLLTVGILVVQEEEFKRWYKLERARYKWPSQRSSTRPRRGRPMKRDAIRNNVETLIEEGQWRASDGFSKLRRLLLSSHCPYVPSVDSLQRLIDRMHTETGKPQLFRPKSKLQRR